MNVIDLTEHPDAVRVLQNACKPNANPYGTWLIYHRGSYSDGINQTKIGRAAWELSEAGVVRLVQKLVSFEPREYFYVAVVV